MAFVVGCVIIFAVVVVMMYSDADYRQGWRNSKFFDDLKKRENNSTDLIDPDK